MSITNRVAPELDNQRALGRIGSRERRGGSDTAQKSVRLLEPQYEITEGGPEHQQQTSLSPDTPVSAEQGKNSTKKSKKKQKKKKETEGFSITGRTGKAVIQLGVFLLTNFIITFFLFAWPRMTPFKYYVPAKKGGGEEYSFTPGRIPLNVEDIPDGAKAEQAYLALFNAPVKFTNESSSDPGWNLQDLLGLPRASQRQDQCCEQQPLLQNQRMMQDFSMCASGCLDSNGMPLDYYDENTGLTKRDYTAQPYGVLGLDYYVNRTYMIKLYDYDFYQMYLANGGAGSSLRTHFGNYGLEGFRNKGDKILHTLPTDNGFVCNLGQRRSPVNEILVQSHGCHVQIASTNGSDYYAYIRMEYKDPLTASVEEVVQKNLVTGCRSRSIVVKAFNPFCRRPLPGMDLGCQMECSVVLFKGHNARRIPIRVVSDMEGAQPVPVTVRVDDQFLVLDVPGRVNTSSLVIQGPNMRVDLSNAIIADLSVRLTEVSDVTLRNLRHNYARIKNEVGDITLLDNRNYELQYRSAANLVCSTAPLVEEIPRAFLACDMMPDGRPDLYAHTFYDTIQDGYIDRDEFMAGLARLNVDFEADSLSLDSAGQQRLLDHVFRYTLPETAVPQLPYELFQEQLRALIPALTTLYDGKRKQACQETCLAGGGQGWQCQEHCTWQCAVNITEPVFGKCDYSQGCRPGCGNPDTPISGSTNSAKGQVDYNFYDVDPPDGVVTYEEMRQALLKLYSNCTYVIEPYGKDYATCRYVGGGLYDLASSTQPRRECTTYSKEARLAQGLKPFDDNEHDWRWNNTNLPLGDASTTSFYDGVAPRECRPFPDYNPKLNGKRYDPSVTEEKCPDCFLFDGSRAPPHYYNRSTWNTDQFDVVLGQLRRIFGDHPRFAYFNISDDDQYRMFGAKMFAATMVRDRVPYETFNNNLQTLNTVDGVGDKYILLNPRCYKGLFLKTGPGDYSSGDAATLLLQSAIQYDSANPNVVTASNMPGYPVTADDGSAMTPCPADWGNGTQGSTQFSYFPWADTTSGYKWGRRLPAWCLDEVWPTGGLNGKFPDDSSKYGTLAGQEVLPGCEPANCGPVLYGDVQQGSIHAQVLPFEFDWYNPRGSYQAMLKGCAADDGSSRCFYKGYPTSLDFRFARGDVDSFTRLKADYSPSTSSKDVLAIMDVHGAGAPTDSRWFWTTNQVYMQLEPAWTRVFSIGVLGPDLAYAKVRLTPGICEPKYGAVEDIDWRNKQRFGPSDVDDGLRFDRLYSLYNRFVNLLQPDDEAVLRGAFILKNVWRQPFPNETLFYNTATFNPLTDTDSGYYDPETKQTLNKGPFFRHKRACVEGVSCTELYFPYYDNCKVERSVLKLTNGTYVLSDCTDSSGALAYTDPMLGSASPAINETQYRKQFSRPILSYPWREVREMSGDKVLERTFYHSGVNTAITNITRLEFDKVQIYTDDSGQTKFKDVSNGLVNNGPLLLTMLLSFLIAAVCGLGIMSVVVFMATRALIMYNENKANEEKVKEGLRQAKMAQYVELVTVDWKGERRAWAKNEGTRMLRPPANIEQVAEKMSKTMELSDVALVLQTVEKDAVRGELKSHLAQMMTEAEMQTINELMASPLELPTVIKDEAMWFAKECGWTHDKDVNTWNTDIMVNNYHYYRNRKPGEDGGLGKTMTSVLSGSFSMLKNKLAAGLKSASNVRRYVEEQEMAKSAMLLDKLKQAAEMRKWLANLAAKSPLFNTLVNTVMTIVRRFYSLIMKLLFYEYPSPFDVINMILMNQFRQRLINSLKTFMVEQCLTDMVMQTHTEYRLGGTLDELEDYKDKKEQEREQNTNPDDDDDKLKVTALGIGCDILKSKNVLGTMIMYRLKWVQIWVEIKKRRFANGEEADVPVVHVLEGPRIKDSGMYRKSDVERTQILELRTPLDTDPECPNDPGGEKVYYIIAGDHNARVVTLNTHGNMAISDLEPRIEFKTSLALFLPPYEKFCMDFGLVQKDILKSGGTLSGCGVRMSKRVVTMLKGLRPKTEDDRLRELNEKTVTNVLQLETEESAVLTFSIPVGVRFGNGVLEAIKLDTNLKMESLAAGLRLGSALDPPQEPARMAAHLASTADDNSSINSGMLPPIRQYSEVPPARGADEDPNEDEQTSLLQRTKQAVAGAVQGSQAQVEQQAHRLAQRLQMPGATGPSEEPLTPSADMRVEMRAVSPMKDNNSSSSHSDDSSDEESDDESQAADPMATLKASSKLIARHIREEYIVTNNFAKDIVAWEDFTGGYKKWCRHTEQDPNSDPFDPEADLWEFGLRYQEMAHYDLPGVMVNERDLEVNTDNSNIQIWVMLQVMTVWMHTSLLWLVPYPLFQVVLYHQALYQITTAVSPQVTIHTIRRTTDDVFSWYIPTANRIILFLLFTWLWFCYFKLFIYYIGIGVPALSRSFIRTLIKSIFWIFLLLILACTISYVFLVMSWLILGAIIKPDSFLPYCVAVVTLAGHAKATAGRLSDGLLRFQGILVAAVAAAFAAKIAATIAMSNAAKGKKEDAETNPKKLEPYPVFKMYAGKDDTMNFEEFSALLDRFDIDMIESKRRMFFAKVDVDGSCEIGYSEFQAAWREIQNAIVEQRMQESGMTKGRMVLLFCYAMFILLLIFAFIFVGVGAFVGTGSFGAVINSCLTAGSGAAMNAGSEDKEDEDEEAGIEDI